MSYDMAIIEFIPLGIDEELSQKISSPIISVYPNPFNSTCYITAPAGATIEIFDILGRSISLLSYKELDKKSEKDYQSPIKDLSESQPGLYIWKPDESLSSGIYFIRATVGEQTITKRAILIR